MAKVTGPLLSMSATGSVGDTLTFARWKGIAYCREWFTPSNPKSASQVNVRTALTLLIASWQVLSDVGKARWNSFAEGSGKSGFNQYVGRGMNEYVIQITTAVTPASVAVDTVGPPGETWTWA